MDEQLNCKDSANHLGSWILSTSLGDKTEDVCFACMMLSLENKQILNIKKSIHLSVFIDVLQTNPHIFTSLVEKYSEVSLHTTMTFLELSCRGNELLVSSASECLLLFLFHTKQEELRMTVVEKLTMEVSIHPSFSFFKPQCRSATEDSDILLSDIYEECNYLSSLPRFRLLGRLFHLFPGIVANISQRKADFYHYIANGMTYPSDEIRGAILYILLQIYAASETNKDISLIDSIVAKGILHLLKTGLTKELTKSTLALLKVFITNESRRVSLLFKNTSEDGNFTTILKKIILSPELSFQVSIIQCLCHILTEKLIDEFQMKELMEENIPEVLFEIIVVKNEFLIESVLCLLLLFSRHSLFHEKSRVIYGMTIILDTAFYLLSLKNWKLLCVTFDLLILFISSETFAATAALQSNLFLQSMQLIEKSFKIHQPRVLLSTCRFLSYFLNKKTLPFPLPQTQVTSILHLALKCAHQFLSSGLKTVSQLNDSSINNLENMSLEMKIFTCYLNIIYCFVRLVNQHQCSLTVEETFVSPMESKTNDVVSSSLSDFYPTLRICILILDEIFIPLCLQLPLKTLVGKYIWCHLIKTLSMLYENPHEESLLLLFTRKLISSHIFNHIWNIRIDDVFLSNYGFEQSICNECIKSLMVFSLKQQKASELYLKEIENGVIYLNCSLQDCASVLSQHYDSSDKTMNSLNLYSAQITYLCLCYMCYLQNVKIIETHVLIPHFIYYITCNSENLISSVLVMKHVIFILALCMYESNVKFQEGLSEVSRMMWELMSKISNPADVYTHHKVLLWWCFKNKPVNEFSFLVLKTWMEFTVHNDNQTFSQHSTGTLVYLLCFNDIAQECFVRQFHSNPQISFSFLKCAFNFNVCQEVNLSEKLKDLIDVLMKHIMVSLVKFQLISHKEETNSDDNFLRTGLECLIWGGKICSIANSEINTKLVFHVTNFCSRENVEKTSLLITCLRFINYYVENSCDDFKAWYVVTGNKNIPSFLLKCFYFNNCLEVDALQLLVIILTHQVKYNLKCTTHIKLRLSKILQWMNNQDTKILALKLINTLIETEFIGVFLQISSLETLVPSVTLTRKDLRILAFYLQNALVLGNPIVDKIAFSSYIKLMKYVAKVDVSLEQYLMLQPWLRVLLESKLEDINGDSWILFEKCFSYHKENVSLIGVIEQFSEKLINTDCLLSKDQIQSLTKLCSGVYRNYISSEIQDKLFKIAVSDNLPSINCQEKEIDLVSQVENIVTNCISNINSSTY